MEAPRNNNNMTNVKKELLEKVKRERTNIDNLKMILDNLLYLSNNDPRIEKNKIHSTLKFISNYEAVSADFLAKFDKGLDIGFIGVEKAGKTTLLLALLGDASLLPTHERRCTQIPTIVKGCKIDEKQFIEIEYLKKEEFDNYYNELKKKIELLEHSEQELSTSYFEKRITRFFPL